MSDRERAWDAAGADPRFIVPEDWSDPADPSRLPAQLFRPEWIKAAQDRYVERQRRRRAHVVLAVVLVAAFLFGLLWPYVLVHT